MVQSVYEEVDTSTKCYAGNSPHAIQITRMWQPLVAGLLVFALCFSVVVWRAAKGEAAEKRIAAGIAATSACCVRWRCHMLTILLGTLGIALGWAAKDVYDAVYEMIIEDVQVDRSKASLMTDIAAVSAFGFTVALFAVYSLYFGECKKQKELMRRASAVLTGTAAITSGVQDSVTSGVKALSTGASRRLSKMRGSCSSSAEGAGVEVVKIEPKADMVAEADGVPAGVETAQV
jgi:hypothetical protein